MSEQVYENQLDFDICSDDYDFSTDRHLVLDSFNPKPRCFRNSTEEWEDWLSFHPKPSLDEDEPIIRKYIVKEDQQSPIYGTWFSGAAESPHISESDNLSEDCRYFPTRDHTFTEKFNEPLGEEGIECQPMLNAKPIVVQEIETNSYIHRDAKKEKRTRCSASKKYPGQISVGFAKFMIKEKLCPKDSTDQKLITMLKGKINGRSKRVDKKDEYKLSSAEKVYAFFSGQGEQLNEEDRKLRAKLRQHFERFFDQGLWREWLQTYFKGDAGSRLWISRNIGEIKKKLFNPEYQPNFAHNDDAVEEGLEELESEHGNCY